MLSSHAIAAGPPRQGTGRYDSASVRLFRAARLLLALPLLWSAAAVAQDADLAIAKDDGSTTYVPGSGVSYQVVVTNNGPDPVLDAVVADPLPAGTVVGTWTCTAAGAANCDQATGIGAISTTVDLPAGDQVTFVLDIVVPPGFTGPLVNTATVAPPGGTNDPVAGNNTDIDTNQPFVPPTVQLAKLSQGGTGTFAFAMTNLSDGADSITTPSAGTTAVSPQVSTVADPAVAVTVTETPATGFAINSASCSDSNAGTTGNPASFGALAGSALTIDPGNLRSGAQIVCTFTNGLEADVSVTKAADSAAVRTGQTTTYALTLANAGPGDASDVVLTDAPGAGLDCTAPSPVATCSASGGAACPGATVPVADLLGGGVTIPDLPVGGQVVVTVQCEVTASGQ